MRRGLPQPGWRAGVLVSMGDPFLKRDMKKQNVIIPGLILSKRKLKWVSILGATLLAVLPMGCRYIVSEPYPGLLISVIPMGQLPRVVKDCFNFSYPDAEPDKVETLSFKKKVDLYRISFRTKDGELTNAMFTCSGSLVTNRGGFPPSQYDGEKK